MLKIWSCLGRSIVNHYHHDIHHEINLYLKELMINLGTEPLPMSVACGMTCITDTTNTKQLEQPKQRSTGMITYIILTIFGCLLVISFLAVGGNQIYRNHNISIVDMHISKAKYFEISWSTELSTSKQCRFYVYTINLGWHWQHHVMFYITWCCQRLTESPHLLRHYTWTSCQMRKIAGRSCAGNAPTPTSWSFLTF